MENERRNGIERYNVLYCKGKYQYKSKYPQIDAKHKIVYAGSVEPMASIWDNISDILRKSERICTESRRELKKLEERSQNQFYFKKNGITHIIIYKCLGQ
jgi:predicted subunit of tRNA(5-methylaminomethyl-2-thiouridylate) methyltransferase